MRYPSRNLRLFPHHRHPLFIGTAAALSLLATALPSAAFAAASTAGNSLLHQRLQLHPFSHRAFSIRGGGSSSEHGSSTTAQGMMKKKKAPPTPTISPFSRPVKKVAVVGGTHGNEYTGVWCIKVIEKQRELYNDNKSPGGDEGTGSSGSTGSINVFEQFPTLEIDTLLANPVAHIQNKRFVDADLNREFSMDKLKRVKVNIDALEECDITSEFCGDNDGGINDDLPHEAVRAREIESLLGPKFTDTTTTSEASENSNDASYNNPATDIVIDLHTTTANMGISLIIPEGDALMSAAAAYVLHKCREKYGEDEAQCLMHSYPKRQDRMNLSSCGRHGFTVEVGPTPQGVIRHDVVEKTETAMHALMEFFHLRNLEIENDNNNNSSEENESSSSSSILTRLQHIYPGGIVPCYRSAPAVQPGELSGKISWPNCPSNPNFPALMVHKSLQDRDFEPLRVGDPLFVQVDGTIIPYDGSHGEEVHLIFVNEGGYYYASRCVFFTMLNELYIIISCVMTIVIHKFHKIVIHK